MKVTIRVRNCKEIDASIMIQRKAIDRKPYPSMILLY